MVQASATAAAPIAASQEPKSSAEPIECVVVHDFYSEDQRYVKVDETFYYTPKEKQPFPWKILRPKDPKLAESLEKEYTDFKQKKQDDIDSRTSVRGTLRSLSNLDKD